MDNKKNIPLEVVHKEIDLIQSCISRMASNSFFLKGWMVSLIAVILAIFPKRNNIIPLFTILIIIILSFWYLDAFFLWTEKKYRKLYEWVLEERKKGNDDKLYDLNSNRFLKITDSFLKVMFSKTLRCFYGTLIILILMMVIMA